MVRIKLEALFRLKSEAGTSNDHADIVDQSDISKNYC